MGSEYKNSGTEGHLIEKCDLLETNAFVYDCVAIGSMDYGRSHLRLTS